ncbi:POTRA domain-containing ShlB-type protein [Lysobacter silvestris]|uniref:POTRA domain-containing ShlB-type protein n=1 Tax=Solilutibacter silvestris TaxID=1645665 RepID=A0A2K1Q4C7_9GAMM|nr:POTRA domain-containing ShlB-type protein [Lysobacter silvestris]
MQAEAQVRPPSTANPLQNLPRVDAPTTPKVNTEVQASAPNPGLATLLETAIAPRRFNVVGVHAVPFEEVAALFSPMTGKTVRVADVLDAAGKISAIYKAHGYALSFGFVPTQDFANGEVNIVVVEGYVADVVIQGDAGNMTAKIRAIAAHITKDRPLRQKTFERYLQVLGMLPGAHIDASVPAPTTTDGATRMVLTVTRTRFNASTGIDFNHPGVQGLTSLTENGLLPLAEQLNFSTLLPPGRGNPRLYTLNYVQLAGSNGLQLRFNGSHYEGNPDINHQLPDYLQQNLRQNQLSLSASYPLRLDNHTNLSVTAGAYSTGLKQSYTNTMTGASLVQQYDLRVLDGKLDYVKVGDAWMRKLNLEIAHGVNGLGASASIVARAGGAAVVMPLAPSFTRYNASFLQSNAWPHRFATVFSVTGQYSKDTLPTTEQLSFGGPRYGLAYDPGAVAGDSGWGASFEVSKRYDVTARWVKQVSPYLVGQYARAYLHAAGSPALATLGTAGVGVRWSDNHHYSFDLSLAQPVADKPPGATHRSTRVNFGFSYQLR